MLVAFMKKRKRFKLFSLLWKAYFFIHSSYCSYIFILSYNPSKTLAVFWLSSCIIITILKHILLSTGKLSLVCFFFFLIYRNPVHSLQVDKCFLCLNLTFFLSSLSNNYHTCCIIIELLTFMPFFSRLETLSSRTFTYSTLGYDVSPVLTLRR